MEQALHVSELALAHRIDRPFVIMLSDMSPFLLVAMVDNRIALADSSSEWIDKVLVNSIIDFSGEVPACTPGLA